MNQSDETYQYFKIQILKLKNKFSTLDLNLISFRIFSFVKYMLCRVTGLPEGQDFFKPEICKFFINIL